YAWPGNVRELANVIERAALMAEVSQVTARELDLRATAPSSGVRPASSSGDKPSIDDVRRARFYVALETHGGNITRASQELGISRNTLKSYMRRYALTQKPVETPRRKAPPVLRPGVPSPLAPIADTAPQAIADSARKTPVGWQAPTLRWEHRVVALL